MGLGRTSCRSWDNIVSHRRVDRLVYDQCVQGVQEVNDGFERIAFYLGWRSDCLCHFSGDRLRSGINKASVYSFASLRAFQEREVPAAKKFSEL